MAHKKSGGGAKNGRDSKGQRRGGKCFGGESVTTGSIIVRQRGTNIHPGRNVRRARDNSLFALKPGLVQYEKGGRRVAVVAAVPS